LISVTGRNNQHINSHGMTFANPESISQLSFQSVSLHGIAIFSGYSQTQTAIFQLVRAVNDAELTHPDSFTLSYR